MDKWLSQVQRALHVWLRMSGCEWLWLRMAVAAALAPHQLWPHCCCYADICTAARMWPKLVEGMEAGVGCGG